MEAKRISQLTEGAFDITIAGLGKIWKFNRSGFTPPSDLLLAQRLPLVDYRKMLLNSTHKSVSLQKKGMKLDLGGIAKGYALDRAVAMLKKHGIAHGLVYGGGDIKLFGNRDGKPKGTPWRVGVQHPRESGKILAKIAITDTAVVTSGDYERFAIKGGERYHHLIDPKEGRPGRKAISATVVGPNAMRADGLATGVFIMGTEGIKLLESLPEVEGLIVNSEGKVFYTTGMRKITTLLRPIHLYKNRVK